jgi:hypothetical protein
LHPARRAVLSLRDCVDVRPIRELERAGFERAVWAYAMFRLKTDAPTTTIADMPKKHTSPIRYATLTSMVGRG